MAAPPLLASAYQAKWVLPVQGVPIEGGVVAIAGERIKSVSQSIDGPPIDLNEFVGGAAALIPALINSHTHLEFSDLEQPLGEPEQLITSWIPPVIRWRRERDAEADADERKRRAIAGGLRESIRGGVARLGEIATSPTNCRDYASPIAVTAFLELIAISSAQNESARQNAFAHLEVADPVGRGLSPHAPYTVNLELLEDAVDLSERTGARLQMHLAESQEELEFIAAASGPFREMLERVGVWSGADLPVGLRPLDYLERLAKSSGCIVAHGNYLADEEIEYVAQHRERLSVAYCPRTHAYFGHDPYPLAGMLAAGVNVALGTDSRASNPDLSVLDEMRFAARRHADVRPADLLEMATRNGAAALGSASAGVLAVDAPADIAVLRVPESAADPHQALLDDETQVAALMISGRWIPLDEEWG